MHTKRRSVILTYHSLDESGSVISVSPSVFAQHMEELAKLGAPVVPLDQVVAKPGSVAITFDDGFCNFAEHAVPVLARHRFPAALFVVSGHCGGTNNWADQAPNAVPRLPLLSWSDLAKLPASIALGAHTATHRHLDALSDSECARELTGCRDEIEHHTGRHVRFLAYPYGAASAAVRAVARRDFDLAVGTTLKFVTPRSDRMELPRMDAYYLRGRFTMERLFSVAGAAYVQVRHALREIRKSASR